MSRRKALLVGCNYPGGTKKLRGCVNDVYLMKKCLTENMAFTEQELTILIDTDASFTQPTRANIEIALLNLVASANSSDILLFYFSGHGDRKLSKSKDGERVYTESIMAADYGLITGADVSNIVRRVPVGATLTILADCCYSGGLIKGAKAQIGDSMVRITPRSHSSFEITEYLLQNYHYVMAKNSVPVGDPVWYLDSASHHIDVDELDRGILLSACQNWELAYEVGMKGPDNSVFCHGYFTYAITTAIANSKGVTNLELLVEIQELLQRHRSFMNPGLYCNDRHIDAPFCGAEISKPESSTIEEEEEKKKKKKKKKKKNKNKNKNKNTQVS